MKIVHVVDSMELGGAETIVSQMCRLQRDQGHDPSVFAVAALGPLGEQLLAEGFSVSPNVGRHLADAARSFYRLFKQSRPDVVHIHNPTPTIYAAIPARIAGVSSIVSTRHSLVAKPRSPVVEMKYRLASTCCDWVVGICDATTDNLKQARSAPGWKTVRVYNGAEPLRRVAGEQCPAKGGFTLVFVGRLAPVKNHPFLLQAFRDAQARVSGLRLWIVGDGSERNRLESLAEELGISAQVKFWGQQLDVAPFLSAADAFIMSSRSEGLPMSLLQAFSLGLPAIVTDVGGMAEVVRLAQGGITVSVSDSAEMMNAIVRMATNNEERNGFSKSAFEAFHARFTLAIMVEAYMELYRNTRRFRRLIAH
jgi:glycosyltransferase involved in cell wall biosynthesis